MVAFASCGDDDNGTTGTTTGGNEKTGKSCTTVDECYPGVDPAELQGETVCLDRVESGYCTHKCSDDSDCCAAKNECDTNLEQVCSPFESTGEQYCFLSCEQEDLMGAGGNFADDGDSYCKSFAHPDFICRSSGGGSKNRKVCVPSG